MDNWDNTRITLIQRIQNQHDTAAWDDFDQIYRRFIYAVIRKMNISEHDAEDLTQQVLLSLWNKLPELETGEIRRFRRWVATITRNCVVDYIRKRTRETARLQQAEQEINQAYLNSIRLPDVDEIGEKQWKIHIVNLAIQNIEPFFSGHALEVFKRSMQGESIDQIATELNLQKRSVSRLKTRVKSRLTEEIERLRQELE